MHVLPGELKWSLEHSLQIVKQFLFCQYFVRKDIEQSVATVQKFGKAFSAGLQFSYIGMLNQGAVSLSILILFLANLEM